MQSIQVELNGLQDVCSSLREEILSLENDNSIAKKALKDANDVIEEYSSREITIEGLNEQIAKLSADKAEYVMQLEKVKAQIESVKQSGALTAVTKNNQAVARAETSVEGTSGGTVYWVQNGKVYHSTANCSTLKRSSNIRSGTISQSGKSRGCKVCY